jgi:uncharacterized protein YbbC (DUF1343 family)
MISLVRFKSTYLILFLCISFSLTSCAQKNNDIKVAAEQTVLYVHLLKGKNIAIVANQTSVIGKKEKREEKREYVHLVDSLLSLGISVKKVFAPEHGFRGDADAGENVKDGFDTKTGLSVLSLHGKSKKPSDEQLKGIDMIVFDIQDVGARFYTYISSLHYVMEAAAENGIPVLIFDRPNPNGHYIDGPVLEPEHSSFLGKHSVPLVYGMTIGEYGQMINGEKWLKNGVQCDLTVIPLKNYTHNSEYSLTIRPSPNLPNDTAINLYPSLGFFEGTIINAGRGTEFQFQRYGASFFPKSNFRYTPKPNFGSKYPKQENKLCYGVDLSNTKKLNSINLEWLIDAYQKTPKTEKFFGETFTIHAGNTKLQEQIEQGLTAEKIKESWQKGLSDFKKIRSNYLIYN